MLLFINNSLVITSNDWHYNFNYFKRLAAHLSQPAQLKYVQCFLETGLNVILIFKPLKVNLPTASK